MIARDIATIPAQGFSWYVLFLEDTFEDPIKQELSTNFLALGHESGPHALVVRGYDVNKFYDSAYEAVTLHDRQWAEKMVRPALLISDTPPRHLFDDPATLAKAKLILVPLTSFRGKPPGTMTDFLRQLSKALRDPDAIRLLSKLEPSAFARTWGWLAQYVDVKPSFMGFGLNVDRILADLGA